MNFYRTTITDCPGPMDRAEFDHKQSDAHARAKRKPEHLRRELRIELVDVQTDAASIERLLNGYLADFKALRTWKLGERGGLVECPNGE